MNNAAASDILSRTSHARGKTAREVSPRREETIGTEAFASLLASTQLTAKARTLSETRQSPSQMFEENGESDQKGRVSSDEPTSETGNAEAVVSPIESPFSAQRRNSLGVSGKTGDAMSQSPSANSASHHRMAVQSQSPAQTEQPQSNPSKAIAVETELGHGKSNAARLSEMPIPIQSSSSQKVATVNFQATPIIVPVVNRVDTSLAKTVGETLNVRSIGESSAGRSVSGGGGAPSSRAESKPSPPSTPQSTPSETNTPKTEQSTVDEAPATPFERMIRSLKLQMGDRVSTARMRLHPPELGEMRVDVQLRGGAIELDVRTMDENARSIVAARAHELRAALKQTGMAVRRLDILVDDSLAGQILQNRRQAANQKLSRKEEQESPGRSELRRALSRRGQLDVRG